MTAWFFKFPFRPSLGGGEFFSLQLAQAIRKQGYGIKLITSDPRLFRLFEKHRLPRLRRTFGREPVSKSALALWPLTWAAGRLKANSLMRGIKTGDVVFLHSLTEKILLTAPLLRRGARIFWLEYKIPGRWLLWNPMRLRYRQLAKKITILTTSEFSKKRFLKHGLAGHNIAVVYPAVVPKSQGKQNNYRIGVLSRLDPEKGVREFVSSTLPLFRQNPDWQLLIAGEGSEEYAIRDLVSKAGVNSQIRLVGFVSDYREFFGEVSAVAYPTRAEESFGMSLLEALASACPAAASRRGAIPEVLRDGNTGFLVTDDSTTAWEIALKALMDPNKYAVMSRAALAQAGEFSPERFERSLKKLLAA